MTLQSDIAHALPELQAADESRMTERFIIDRPTTTEVDDDGDQTTTYEVIYDGPGRVPPYFPHPQTPDVGAGTATVERSVWRIPAPERIPVLASVWAGPIRPGDRGRRYVDGTTLLETVLVIGQHAASQATATRLIVDDPTGGAFA